MQHCSGDTHCVDADMPGWSASAHPCCSPSPASRTDLLLSNTASADSQPIVVPAALLISWPYIAAMTAGIAEYLLESKLWPLQLIKQQHQVAYAGMFLVVLGEAIRKLAMVRFEPPY